MNEVIGTRTTYFITQVNLETETEQFVEYNNYVGSFVTTSSVDSATRFDSEEKAIGLAKLQNQMAELLNKQLTYRVIEEIITRTEVYSEIEEPEEEPEEVEPDLPETEDGEEELPEE